MNTQITQEMIDYCRNLGETLAKPRTVKNGLCDNFSDEFDEQLEGDQLDDLIPLYEYPNFSGLVNFPVPHPYLGPQMGYLYVNNLWDNRTTYTKNRRHFCRWVADELEREMKSQEEAARYHHETLQQESTL